MHYGGKECWVDVDGIPEEKLFPFPLIWLWCELPANQGGEEPNAVAQGQGEGHQGGRCRQGHQAAGGGGVPDADGGGSEPAKAGKEERGASCYRRPIAGQSAT